MHALALLTRTVIGLSLFVPLIVLPEYFLYPFIVPKVLVFRSLVEIMLGAWVVLVVASRERFSVRWTPMTILAALFLFSFAVSTLAGVDRYRSLWDTHERMLGLFTITHYVAFYFVATTVVRGWRSWRNLFLVLLAVSAVVMLVALAQRWVAPHLLHNLFHGDPDRVSSTLGHPAYLGGFGSFTFLLAFLVAAREWRGGQEKVSEAPTPAPERLRGGLAPLPKCGSAAWFAILVGALGLVGVVISETRGALLGLTAGVVGLMLCYALVLERGSRLRAALVVLLLLGMVGVGTLYSLRNWDGLLEIPGLRRFHGVSLARETARTRVMAWGIAIEAASERPLLGWGPNNYYFAFNKHYRPEFLAFGWKETWFDNAHNVLLNTLAMQGVVGLLLYLGLLSVPLALLYRGRRRGKVDPHTAAVGGGFIAMHLVNNMFVFENPTSWLYLVLMLAFLDSSLRGETEATGGSCAPSRGVALVVTPLVVAVVWLGNIDAARANMAGLDAIRYVGAGRADEALAAFATSSRILSPHIDGVRQNLLDVVMTRFGTLSQARAQLQARHRAQQSRAVAAIRSLERQAEPDVRQRLDVVRAAELRRQEGERAERGRLRRLEEELLSVAVRAYDELGKNAWLHPLDVRVVVGRARLALKLSTTFSEVQLGGVDRVREVEKELVNAQPNSPRRQEIQYLLAAVKVDGGFRARRARRALFELGRAGEREAADRLRTELERDRRRRGDEAIALLRASIESEPRIGEGWWRLALVHQWMGRTARAREVLAEALEQGVEFKGEGKAAVEQILELPVGAPGEKREADQPKKARGG